MNFFTGSSNYTSIVHGDSKHEIETPFRIHYCATFVAQRKQEPLLNESPFSIYYRPDKTVGTIQKLRPTNQCQPDCWFPHVPPPPPPWRQIRTAQGKILRGSGPETIKIFLSFGLRCPLAPWAAVWVQELLVLKTFPVVPNSFP